MSNEDAVRLFRAMYGEMADGEHIELRIKKGVRTTRAYFHEIDRAAMAAKSMCTGGDVFYGVALRDGKGGSKSNIVRIPCLWADLDAKDGLDEPMKRVALSPVTPSAGVASGRGIHLYWFLDQSVGISDAYKIEQLNKAIAKVVQGDAVHDTPRLLRVPGTLNWKYGEPLHVQLLTVDAGKRYTIEHMCDAFGCPEFDPPLVDIYTPRESAESDSLPCRREMWAGVEEGSRNAVCFQLAVDLKRDGLARSIATHALTQWGQTCHPPLPASEVRNVVKSAYSGKYAGLGCDKMGRYCGGGCPVGGERRVEGGEQRVRKGRGDVGTMGGDFRTASSELKRGLRTQMRVSKGPDSEIRDKPWGRDSEIPAQQHAGQLATRNAELETVSSPLPVWTPSELAEIGLNPPEFVVDKLVPARGVTMITGEGGIGKSFVVVDMACAVATGGKFLGQFDCKRKPVLMVDLENDEPTIARRLRKVAKGRGCTLGDLEVYIIRKGDMSLGDLRIDNPAGRDMLEATIDQFRPGVLVIDPMVAIHGQDENNNIAMRQVVMILEELARTYELGVVIVHHHRKRGQINDSGQMMRGASDLRNAAVSHISMRRISRDRISIDHDKCRQAEAVQPFMIEMTDSEDGSAIYLRHIGDSAPVPTKTKRDQAREVILKALGDGEVWERLNLLAMCTSQGISTTTAVRALTPLVEDGTVSQPTYGTYALQAD